MQTYSQKNLRKKLTIKSYYTKNMVLTTTGISIEQNTPKNDTETSTRHNKAA